MPTGMIFNIQRYCVHDGPGIRTTLFFKGCPLDCWWCHNPESKSARIEIARNDGRCIRCGACSLACPRDLDPHNPACPRCGACAAVCPAGAREAIGRQWTVAQALTEIVKDRIFHEDSGGGVTFSGGEPLMQFEFLLELLRACRQQEIHTALDTCGYAPEAHVLQAASLANLVLFDLKLIDDAQHRRHTGVSNERILSNLRALAAFHPNIWIRIPLVPGINDIPGELDALADTVAHLPGAAGDRRICLLPYHATGTGKLARLGLADRMGAIQPPAPEQMKQAAEHFRARGLEVQIGG